MWPRDTYKKYILQKNWVKTVIPAFSSGQSNLPSRQLDDQHRNTNMNDKDHLVGQLTRFNPNPIPMRTWVLLKEDLMCQSCVTGQQQCWGESKLVEMMDEIKRMLPLALGGSSLVWPLGSTPRPYHSVRTASSGET